MAIGQGFHAKPSPTLGSLPAGHLQVVNFFYSPRSRSAAATSLPKVSFLTLCAIWCLTTLCFTKSGCTLRNKTVWIERKKFLNWFLYLKFFVTCPRSSAGGVWKTDSLLLLSKVDSKGISLVWSCPVEQLREDEGPVLVAAACLGLSCCVVCNEMSPSRCSDGDTEAKKSEYPAEKKTIAQCSVTSKQVSKFQTRRSL